MKKSTHEALRELNEAILRLNVAITEASGIVPILNNLAEQLEKIKKRDG